MPRAGAPPPFQENASRYQGAYPEANQSIRLTDAQGQEEDNHGQGSRAGRQQGAVQACEAGPTPGKQRPYPHEKNQGQEQRPVYLVVKGPGDGNFLSAQLGNQGIYRPPQGHESYAQQQEVVDQEGCLAGQHRVQVLGAFEEVVPPEENAKGHYYPHRQEEEKDSPQGGSAKGMYRGN